MVFRTLPFLATAYLLGSVGVCHSAGFQFATAPDPDDQALRLGIWYPSDAPPNAVEGLRREVALNGAARGTNLPLIIISHGNGGVFSGHDDTAIALADAGFVVAAASHTGDHFQDQSYAGMKRWFSDRPRHVARVIDYMVGQWAERARIDESRIGFFGFSMGGFTGLVSAGATPDFARIRSYCSDAPEEFTCALLMRLNSEVLTNRETTTAEWIHEARIKAVVLASPGFPYAFAREEIEAIDIPVQLWAADGDEAVRATEISELQGMLSEKNEFHLVDNAGHFVFLPPCNFSPQFCADSPGFDRAEFHRELNASIISFFTEKLDIQNSTP